MHVALGGRPCVLIASAIALSVGGGWPVAWAQSGVQSVPEAAPPPPVTVAPAPQLSPLAPVAPAPTSQPVPQVPVRSAPTEAGQPQAGSSFDSVVQGYRASPSGEVAGPVVQDRVRRISGGGFDLVEALAVGREHDATFRAAIAERDANRQTADQTITGYLPQASYSYQNIPTESGARHVATVTQPIISMSGLATVRQRGPRRRYADATLIVREQDLAVRIMTAVADIIKAREASTLNDARIRAFRTQSERADRLYRNGLGTVTDARDISVRYEQAQANAVLLRSDEIAALARLRSIVGEAPAGDAFRLPPQFGRIELQPLGLLTDRQERENPQIAAARETERISKLEADRVRGGMFPVVGASATYTHRNGVSDSFVGISLNAPINAGGFFQLGAANAAKRRAFEERRQVQERARTEMERLYAMVDGGQQALVISAKAVEGAELSVEANTKSYEGGVRTNVDVVNAIQTVFEVKNAYVNSATTLALNYLNLLLLSGEDAEDAMAATQAFLFAK